MKLLSELLYKVKLTEVFGDTHIAITSVEFDSRKVRKYSLFVALKGTETDGNRFVNDAIEKGAIVIVSEKTIAEKSDKVTYITVSSSTEALATLAANFYNNPSTSLKLIGVTGTNGKTTTVSLLHKLFTELGKKCGLISTVVYLVGKQEYASTHTTPDVVRINELLRLMVENGCEYCFMEVSSHSVVQGRIFGLNFTGGIFTNLTHDHLDYHGTFENYRNAKKGFFDLLPKHAFALVNKDDKNGMFMLQNTAAKRFSYSLKGVADFHAKLVENHITGLILEINRTELHTQLVGNFNAQNILAVTAVAFIMGEEKETVLQIVSTLKPPAGRFETFRSPDGKIGIVDYAHTPDALDNVLGTINQLKTHHEKIITVVGCGGNRDAAKRPIMANIAAKLSNKVVLTSDNPRNEDPSVIISQMKQGLTKEQLKTVLVIENRKEAIHAAVMLAESGDIILVAGKGHETYQEINGVKEAFDDRKVLMEAFKTLSTKN